MTNRVEISRHVEQVTESCCGWKRRRVAHPIAEISKRLCAQYSAQRLLARAHISHLGIEIAGKASCVVFSHPCQWANSKGPVHERTVHHTTSAGTEAGKQGFQGGFLVAVAGLWSWLKANQFGEADFLAIAAETRYGVEDR
jgi:hypothetical protein